jgi:hypothetical protein
LYAWQFIWQFISAVYFRPGNGWTDEQTRFALAGIGIGIGIGTAGWALRRPRG